jgi:hypothetical protein
MTTGGRGGYWTAVAAAAAVLAAGIVLVVRSAGSPSGPDGVVRAYFAALSRADAPAALALAVPPSGPHAFLTSDVRRIQQNLAPLRDFSVDAVDGTGNARTVSYSYELEFAGGPVAVSGDVRVVQRTGDWRLASAAVPVRMELDAASSRATLAGAAVPEGTVDLFPGAVPVRFDTPALRLDGSNVTFGRRGTLTLDVAVSDSERSAVRTALVDHLRSCFPSGAASAASCPLPDDPRIVPGSLRGTIELADLAHLDYEVESLASGPIGVDGTVGFQGRYARLDDNNIAQVHSGRLQVQIRATTPSVGPVRLQYLDATS